LAQQTQALGELVRHLQSVYLSGAPTRLLFDLLVKLNDAENQASGLSVKTITERTTLNSMEAYRCVCGIASFTGERVVAGQDGEVWLHTNYEPRSVGLAAMGMGRVIPKPRAVRKRMARSLVVSGAAMRTAC